MDVNLSPQEQWERVKRVTKKVIQRFGVKHVNWRKQSIKHLERKRNRPLRSKPPKATLRILLPRIDSMLQILQQELVDIAALKAGDIWREKGERSAGYLKHIHQQQSSQQYMASLQAPASSGSLEGTTQATMGAPGMDPGAGGSTGAAMAQVSTDSSGNNRPLISDNLEDMKSFAWQFYTNLYKADPVESRAIDAYLDPVNFEKVLTTDEQQDLMAPITLDELLQQASRSTKATSPGSDGLPYPFLSLLFSMPRLKTLVLQVYNDALKGLFPSSWHDLRIRLLLKKGLLALLKNWRPICLIGCDAKVFTNAWLLSLVVSSTASNLAFSNSASFVTMEKAYDRVHPDYLCAVLHRLGFPASFVSCLKLLFFGNDMYININGYFTSAVRQERGIRQGDPLSPLLFDVALKPFLLSILQDPAFCGFKVGDCLSADVVSSRASPAIKCLAYADDVCVFLRDEHDLSRLQHHMASYAAVSNAKFNEDKSEAFSLDGTRSSAWERALGAMNIQTYYHGGSSAAFRYLGLHFAYNHAQRAQIEERLLTSVRTQCLIYSKRQLSIMGRVTIVYSLILSKVWYCLRMLKPTQKFLDKIKSCIYQFIWQKKRPQIRKELIFLPKS